MDDFLAANYGEGVTMDVVRTMELENALAYKAYTTYEENLSFTEEELAEEYAANLAGEYDLFSGAYYMVQAQPDDQGQISDMARAEARAEADAILMSYQDGYDVEDLYDRFNGYIEEMHGESAGKLDRMRGSNLSGELGDWMKDPAREPGDVTVIPEGDNCTAVLFLGRESGADFRVIDIRHILIMTEADENGGWTEEKQAEAKAEAERILAEWEAGDRTEESFAALAEQYSADGGSNTNGGLYEDVYPGQMVPEFNDFCFAEGRQPGDTGIVHGNNGGYDGYHVMYFSGEGELYRDILARQSLTQKAVDELLNREIEVVPGPGEALVGMPSAQERVDS